MAVPLDAEEEKGDDDGMRPAGRWGTRTSIRSWFLGFDEDDNNNTE